ncbi:MAG: nitrilase-related carbon-nitrogen hydrolase [bacterium]|nr:nitrilase-related carbon-nitrogen hydrolase [bacterium]
MRPRHRAFALYSVLSGVLIGLALPPSLFRGLSFIAIAPFIALLWSNVGARRLMAHGTIAGTTAAMFYFSWIFETLPLTWLGVHTTPVLVGIFVFTVLSLGLFWGIFFGLFLVAVKKIVGAHTSLCPLAALLLWPVFEYIRTFAYSFHPYTIGEGTIVGDHTGFMLLGDTLAEIPAVRMFAPFLGDYGLSMIVLLPNIAFALFMVGSMKNLARRQALVGASFFAIFVMLWSVGALHLSRATHSPDRVPIRIAIVQTAFGVVDNTREGFAETASIRAERARRGVVLQSLFTQALARAPDMVVMPEGIGTVFEMSDTAPYPDLTEIRMRLGEERDILVLDTGLPPKKWNRNINPATLLDNTTGVIGTHEKRFLMPWGEYTPYVLEWVTRVFDLQWRDLLFRYRPGSKIDVFETRLGAIAVLICSELVSPKMGREVARRGADISIIASSEAILHSSERLQAQNLAIARIRAASFRKPLVYVSNGGRSFALDERGEILWQSASIGEVVAVVEVTPNNEKTIAAYLLP